MNNHTLAEEQSLPIYKEVEEMYNNCWNKGLGQHPKNPHHIENYYNQTGSIDFHSWVVERATGKIIDPTPPPVPWMAPVYKPFPRSVQRRILSTVVKRVTHEDVHNIVQDGYIPRRCIENCLAFLEQNIRLLNQNFVNYKIVYGHQGFVMANGKIFWEFG